LLLFAAVERNHNKLFVSFYVASFACSRLTPESRLVVVG